MDKLDLAGALREAIAESRDTQNSVSQTTTTTATALTDSENGRVTVDFGGVTIAGDDDSQGVECDTLVSVRAGDTVTVQLVGATGTARHATVIGVVGRGDEQDARIAEAERTLIDLAKAKDAADAAMKALEEAIAAYKSASDTRYESIATRVADNEQSIETIQRDYVSDSDLSTTLKDYSTTSATAEAISAEVAELASTVEGSYAKKTELQQTADGIEAKVSKKVSVGDDGTVSDLSSVMRLDANGLDIGAMENGSPSSTYAHIDDDEFSIVSGGQVISKLSESLIMLAKGLLSISVGETSHALLETSAQSGFTLRHVYDTGRVSLGIGYDDNTGPYCSIVCLDSNISSTFLVSAGGVEISSPGQVLVQGQGGNVRVGSSSGNANLYVSGNIYYGNTHGVTALYQLYNSNGGQHYFTTDATERNSLIKAGWQAQGIKCYVFKS